MSSHQNRSSNLCRSSARPCGAARLLAEPCRAGRTVPPSASRRRKRTLAARAAPWVLSPESHRDTRCTRIFPVHVFTALRGAGFVFLEAIAVEVAVAIDPFRAAQRHVAVLADQCVVAGPFPGLVQQDQVERRGVGRAVVGRMRDTMEMGEFAKADLVRDLAWIRIRLIVARGGLEFSQLLERAAGESQVHRHVAG